MNPAAGIGAAHDATVLVENNVPALEAALAEARERQEAAQPVIQLARAQAKLEKLQRAVEAASEEVARLEAEGAEA